MVSVPATHLFVFAVVVALLGLGCGAQPAPLNVQAGTTFTLMIPNGFSGGTAGFGRAAQSALGPASTNPSDFQTGLPTAAQAPYDPSSPLEDVQRGEIAVKLWNATHAFWLPVRYLTRVDAAAESDAGLDGRVLDSGQSVGGFSAAQGQVGQIVAFLDVPAAVPQGDYSLRPVVIRREPVTANFVFVHDTFGPWGAAGSDSLFVLAADLGPGIPPPAPTPLSAIWANLELTEAQTLPMLDDIVPNPSATLLFVNAPPPDFTAPVHPAAATVELTYPSNVFEIKGVVHHDHMGSGSSIRWHTDDIAGEPEDCTKRRSLTLHLVDADERTATLGIVFDLVDAFGSCPGAASLADFELVQARGYDTLGVAIDPTAFGVAFTSIF